MSELEPEEQYAQNIQQEIRRKEMHEMNNTNI